MGARLPDHGKGPDDQDAPQVSIALLGDGSQPLLAAGRILARDDADPGREVTPLLKDRNVGNRGDNGTRAEDANARNGLKPFAVCVFAMLSEKALLDGTNLDLARGNLRHKRREASPCILGQADITAVGNDRKQHLQTVMALCSDDADSARCERSALMACVRWRISRSRTRCCMSSACCSGVFTGTVRTVGRRTASQQAAASTESFLLRLTYAFTSLAGISRTSWPSFLSSRAQ